MTDKPADGYLLPGASRQGVPQVLQMKAHEGFTQEFITPRNPVRLTVGEGPVEQFLASPPAWTKDAACLGRQELTDEPDAHTYRTETKPMCDSCDVQDLCLREAMSFEVYDADGRPLPPKHRHGIWGGLKPRERAELVWGEPEGTCGRGHDLQEVGAMLGVDGGWTCQECERIRKRRYAAERKHATFQKVACDVCGTTMQRKALTRHRKNKHPDLTFAAEENAA